MWIVEQRDPAGSWFTRATVEQQDAEHFARLTHNPKLRFRYRRTDEEGEPDDNKPVEVDSSDPGDAADAP
jgi:hypothetical protein